MKKIIPIIAIVLLAMASCRQHVYHTFYGEIDIDTMKVAFYDIKDSLPCYLVHVSDLDSVEKSPGVWGYIYGPLKYYYCPAKDTYYHTFPDNQGREVVSETGTWYLFHKFWQ